MSTSELSWTRCDNSAQGAYWMKILPDLDYVVFVMDPGMEVRLASVLCLKQGSKGLDVSDRRNWSMLSPMLAAKLLEVMDDFTINFAEGTLR